VAAETNIAPFPALIAAASSDGVRNELVGAWILCSFERFYETFRRLTWLAKTAFETREHPAAVAHARTRLGLYDKNIYALADEILAAYPALVVREDLWDAIKAAYRPQVDGRYEADLAIAYLHSVMRRVHAAEWWPVDYAFGEIPRAAARREQLCLDFPGGFPVDSLAVRELLQVGELGIPFHDLERDAALVANRLNENIADGADRSLLKIEMLRGCFFRNRGAYLVGRLAFGDGRYKPLVVALQNRPEGVVACAVLTTIPHVHNLFSSTQASFQVTNFHYHEISEFLYTIMPRRPLGLQYSTIGFHHVSKVAIMTEVTQQLVQTGETLDTAPGSPGTVAIAFSAPCLAYILKVIRDRPTDGYKWDTFAGAEAVLDKYRRVHEINRTGSMLDNTIYYNLKLERAWFHPRLLQELVAAAGNAVRLQGDTVVFKYLVVQRTLMPLNVYLKTAAPDKARRAINNLGHCIKNNAAANIFNRDFDARNYGVTRYLKVYLYDFDAVEALTDVKVRTNTDRIEGEEGIPEWYFEPGFVFLPEEMESGLRVDDRELRREFRTAHGDLMTVSYWQEMQAAHRAGQIPGIRTYPENCSLGDSAAGITGDE
jgi:isocitrate dehydrogenase kinase/phosphatase